MLPWRFARPALIDLKGPLAYLRAMSLRDIITLPDPLLRQTSKPVSGVDKATRKVFDDMLETMYGAPGIGLEKHLFIMGKFRFEALLAFIHSHVGLHIRVFH